VEQALQELEAAGEYWPAGQGLQSTDPAAEKVPAWHVADAEVSSEEEHVVPAAHGVQDVAPLIDE